METVSDRVERLRRRTAEELARRRNQARFSTAGRAAEEAAATARFLGQVWLGITWVYEHSGWLGRSIRWLAARVWYGYRWLWDRAVYRHPAPGVRLVSKTRAGLMVLATWAFLWFATFPVLELVLWDSWMFTFFHHIDEPLYLRGPQGLNGVLDETHAIRGCRELPCDETNSVYFRVENDLMSNLWSLAHLRGLSFPEYVAAAVPYETTLCRASSFGIRLRGTSRWLNYFPQLLDVSCGTIK